MSNILLYLQYILIKYLKYIKNFFYKNIFFYKFYKLYVYENNGRKILFSCNSKDI